MRSIWLKRMAGVLVLAAAVGGAAWMLRPRPVAVDLATVMNAAMEVTVDDEAKTRMRHVYTVSAPVAGKVLRISAHLEDHHVGDPVTADETVVAVMQPMAPSFIDVRSREELQAAVAAAEAAVKFAESEVRRIEAALEFSHTELQRAQTLARNETISAKALDRAKLDVETNEAALASARAQLEVRKSERASAAARLIDPSSVTQPPSASCCIQLHTPVTGRILKIVQESEAVVPSGTPLIEIGDPLDLEVVADLLSTDAVQIKSGAPVRIDGWGDRRSGVGSSASTGGFPQGLGTRDRGAARPHHDRFRRSSGSLGAARARLPRDSSRHCLEFRQGAHGTSGCAIPQGR